MRQFIHIFLIVFATLQLNAQNNCVFKEPLVNIDFGEGDFIMGVKSKDIPGYVRVTHSCPNDGFYSFVPRTGDCFKGDWFTLKEDHTPGDQNGNMMLVNASYEGGIFFSTTVTGLKKHTTFEFGAWMINICRINNGCPPLLPDILILIKTTDGKKLAEFRTGLLTQYDVPRWRKYVGLFQTGSNEKNVIITMQDLNPGGCGNDFALDDITLRECIRPVAVPVQKNTASKKEIKKVPVATRPVKVSSAPNKKPEPVKEITGNQIPVAVEPKESVVLTTAMPEILRKRSNPLIRTIETESGEISIRLYDNGQIDGDTVSIYHNGQLIVSKAALSQKPVTLNISVDKTQPHHELVMVAENLGSIPPNTSLMIVSTPSKRYEVFISSTEQKNAKVVIDWKD